MTDDFLDTVRERLVTQLELDDCTVSGGAGKYEVHAVGSCFDSVSRVKRQQLVQECHRAQRAELAVHDARILAADPEGRAS